MRTILSYFLYFSAIFFVTWGTLVLVDGVVQIGKDWAVLSLLLSIENVVLFFVFRNVMKKNENSNL